VPCRGPCDKLTDESEPTPPHPIIHDQRVARGATDQRRVAVTASDSVHPEGLRKTYRIRAFRLHAIHDAESSTLRIECPLSPDTWYVAVSLLGYRKKYVGEIMCYCNPRSLGLLDIKIYRTINPNALVLGSIWAAKGCRYLKHVVHFGRIGYRRCYTNDGGADTDPTNARCLYPLYHSFPLGCCNGAFMHTVSQKRVPRVERGTTSTCRHDPECLGSDVNAKELPEEQHIAQWGSDS